MDPELFIAELRRASGYEDQIVAHRKLAARQPRFAATRQPLSAEVDAALDRAGITQLFVHQAKAIDRLRRHAHTVVATGTASGKSLTYQVPMLEASERDGTSLYLCPTKALAHDQLRQLARYGSLRAATYDGDTPQAVRSGIRRDASVILTNPDMLHMGILPRHANWARFLRSLQLVVIDEAHVFRGVFGSHVALVLRRLRRLCDVYGSDPVFALASATIGNPAEHASELTGLPVGAVLDDGSPRSRRHIVFWNPPLQAETDRRRSSNAEAAALLRRLVDDEARSLAFSKSRVSAELVAKYAGRGVKAYRAGFLAAERREVEAGLQSGAIPAVSATNALELGVDIGGLDAVVLNGFPGTVASAWQQAGRAGRSSQESLAVIVPADEPLDQFYAANPGDFFGKPHEAALINPSNPYILGPHLGCAAYERPLDDGDDELFGPASAALIAGMESDGDLRDRKGRRFWARPEAPAGGVDIRSAGGSPYRIVEYGTGRVIGTVDAGRAFTTVHPGAIYLHQSETFRVRDLVIADRVALVSPESADEYTQAKTVSDTVILQVERSRALRGAQMHFGLVEVSSQVVAFERHKLPHGELMGTYECLLPPERLITRAVWYVLPADDADAALDGLDVPSHQALLGALHAAEHAAIGLLPRFAMCDRWDIGGLSTNHHPQTGAPTVFIHDGYPMGAGIAEHAFAVAEEHLATTASHVGSCVCRTGCPSCVQSPKCGNGNEPLHKAGAVRILHCVLGR